MSTTEPERTAQASAATEPPPVGEEIHIPGGSVLPLVVAIGITLMVIGTTVWWVWSVLGFIILVVSAGLWIRDARHEFDALPEDHHHR